MKIVLGLMICVGLLAGCDADRIAKLEKENADLKAKVEKQSTALNFDLQQKTAKDARSWFASSFTKDKDTIYLDYTNHYNKKLNTCFVWVERHNRDTDSQKLLGPWFNIVEVWNVYENSKYGSYVEHNDPKDQQPHTELDCDVGGKSCSSLKEFQNLTQSFFND